MLIYFPKDGESVSVEMMAIMIQSFIHLKTGKVVRINLPLQTDREKELFIKAIESIERQSL